MDANHESVQKQMDRLEKNIDENQRLLLLLMGLGFGFLSLQVIPLFFPV